MVKLKKQVRYKWCHFGLIEIYILYTFYIYRCGKERVRKREREILEENISKRFW